MLRAVQRVLTPHYEVLCCALPSEALQRVDDWGPEIALIDLRMPQMSGFELLDKLRERCPGIDTIVMTGSVHELDTQIVRAIQAKAYYFIQKPFDRQVLLTLMDRCIETRRLQEQNRRHVQRLEGELRIARQFQQSLLPPTHARFGRLELWARYSPAWRPSFLYNSRLLRLLRKATVPFRVIIS